MPDKDYDQEAQQANDWFAEQGKKKYAEEHPDVQPSDELIFNPTTAQMQAQTQYGMASTLGSLEQQAAAQKRMADLAAEGVIDVEQRGQAALAGEREKSGRSFAAQMAQGGGGSLAGMRQSQLSRGIAEGQLMGEFGMQKIAAERLAAQAQKEAAAAQGEVATERQKLQKAAYEGQNLVQTEVNEGLQKIKNKFNELVREEGGYWSDDDKRTMANWIYQNYANEATKKRNPALYNAAVSAIDDVLAERGAYNP